MQVREAQKTPLVPFYAHALSLGAVIANYALFADANAPEASKKKEDLPERDGKDYFQQEGSSSI